MIKNLKVEKELIKNLKVEKELVKNLKVEKELIIKEKDMLIYLFFCLN